MFVNKRKEKLPNFHWDGIENLEKTKTYPGFISKSFFSGFLWLRQKVGEFSIDFSLVIRPKVCSNYYFNLQPGYSMVGTLDLNILTWFSSVFFFFSADVDGAAAQLSRVSVLINVDSGFLFGIAAYRQPLSVKPEGRGVPVPAPGFQPTPANEKS